MSDFAPDHWGPKTSNEVLSSTSFTFPQDTSEVSDVDLVNVPLPYDPAETGVIQ